ncbi:MAG TPA: amidohydrolase [Mycobacteriales bacterium]|nr:amidohydrolase [Mycobacteriales bacterium]
MRALDDFLATTEPALVALRRDLHAHPELGREEHRTTSLLLDRLTAAGMEPRVLGSGTGVVVDIGTGAGPVVALRADIDALPVPDGKDVSYRSTRGGVCHACGHDVHTAVVLGAALALAAQADALPGRVRVLFQPAEELMPGGALDAIADGVLDDVAAIFALHCHPGYEVGEIGIRSGAITAAADQVEIVLTGPGGHTARPHATSDLVYVAARVVTDLPAGLSRLVDPRQGMSLVFGSIAGGSAANVIPRVATVRGTLRVLGQEAWDDAPKLVERLLAATVEPLGASYELSYTRGVPPVCNDPGATAVLIGAATTALGSESVVTTEQSLGGEDFAWYLQHVPGAMARLGVRPARDAADLHSPAFDIDERAIAVGVRVLVQTALDALLRYA